MNRLLQLLNGRKIAIVGNGNVKKNMSDEIDNADVVIRFNHFYNYDSNNVGKRVDIVLQTVTKDWYNAPQKHLDVIQKYKPEIFIVKRPDLYRTKTHETYGKGVKINKLGKIFEPWYKYTTGTCALIYLSQNLKNAEVKCYGFQDNDDWNRYINTDAKKYKYNEIDERQKMLESISILEKLKINKPYTGVPKVIVIPVKANSQGAPNKNRFLIRHCIRECLKSNKEIHVIGDDDVLLRHLQEEYNNIKTCLLSPIGTYTDITQTLKEWVNKTNFCGDIALTLCTAPNLKHEWIDECFNKLKFAPITATACELNFKPTALYKFENNIFVPYSNDAPPASTARQLLPYTIRITGAVVAFHTDCLQNNSLYQGGVIEPVMIDEKDSLDVDTKEELQLALQQISNQKS